MQTSAPAGVSPDNDVTSSAAQQQLRLGLDLYKQGRAADAIAAFRHGLAEAEKSGTESTEIVSELHSKLGNVAAASGDVGLASASYQAALTIAPHLTNCWCSFGDLHLRCGQHQSAIELYLQALRINPRHWAARANMVQALMAAKQYLVAKAILIELKGERPQDARIHHLLGKTLFELNEIGPAIESFQEAVALNPQDAESINWIGALRQAAGDDKAAQQAYAEAARIEPLIRRPAARQPAEFRVLALYAPFGGNTPTEYLFENAFFDTDTLSLFPDRDYDTAALGENIHLVINLVSDADQTGDLLPLAADLVDRFGLPTVNHPRKVAQTTRDAVAKLLGGIPHCRVPQALRLKAGSDHSEAALEAMLPFTSSCLARPVGTHGGDDFEKVEDLAGLSAFLSQRADHDHYLIEYIDYLSADGHFRKYRFIFVDDQVLPYHLCIGSDWKLHHINTDMAHHAWMQQEEAAFLGDAGAVFGQAQMQALHDIRARMGLDYFGIDCGLDRDGNVVVFEVNASMLVHARNEGFLYKTPAVERIKSAYDAMLRKLVKPR
ncbi:tetratricopeptide repeat protein [Bradyrhizobium erythrophlei]|uniref:Tetratricopeptide repeat-containing protein n=1 Tax=Bradyrhizobium erythrophlei TaxID=1437360 RepID=A0A1M7TK35_9BRAD|nr:tetratricopeptide repeat protein [Bradyrhizobium erythrophlei]SHN71075.1 Tetratricopeptide repeat-containing protein [Bradyrhizobium erythrophlei]